jgi:two-component system nitrogen regulation response regulator NtrX
VERMLILASGDVIQPSDLPPLPGAGQQAAGEDSFFDCNDFQQFKSLSEGAFLQHKLKENLYNVSKTAEVLGMQRSNLYKKITKYGLRTQPAVD